jgi:Concanavalin A-like lectin/glucanases superfamily
VGPGAQCSLRPTSVLQLSQRGTALSSKRSLKLLLVLLVAVFGCAFRATVAFASTYSNAVVADNPAAYWRLGEGVGSGIAADSSGHGYQLVYLGATLGVDGALNNDGDSAISVDNGTGAQSGEYAYPDTVRSVELWVRMIAPAGPNGVTLAESGRPWDAETWWIGVDGGGHVSGVLDTGTRATTIVGSTIDDGLWHHVVVVFAGAATAAYVDSVASSSAPTTEPWRPGLPPGCVPGCDPSVLTLGGTAVADMDEVATYSYALTASQVTAHYTAGAGQDFSSDPALTAAQVSQAASIANADQRVGALIAGRGASIGDVSAWTKSNGNVIGAVLTYTWSTPAAINTTWPAISPDPAEATDPPYQTGAVQYSTQGVTGLVVLVDLNCGSVAQIEPDDNASVDESSSTIVTPFAQPAACGFRNGDPGINYNVRLISVGASAFYNYEFTGDWQPTVFPTTNPLPASWKQNTENPIDLIFTGQVFTKADAVLYDNGRPGTGTGFVGSTAYAGIAQGYGWARDQNNGYKDNIVCWTDTHYRLYQDGRAHSDGTTGPGYSLYWGYYAIGAAHHDRADTGVGAIAGCWGWTNWFGKNEDAERHVADKAAEVFGTGAVRRHQNGQSVVFLNNHEPTLRIGPNHYHQNDGWATMIHVCVQNSQQIHCP